MHFRDRGRSIQLVRTSYNKDSKKPTTEILGRLIRPKLEFGDDAKAKLTPEEIAEVEAFRSRVGRRENLETEYAVARFPDTIATVSDWLKDAGADDVARFVDEVQKPLAKLRRQILKASGNEKAAD
jgi:hypothetical protein